jgi:hypothetical protein
MATLGSTWSVTRRSPGVVTGVPASLAEPATPPVTAVAVPPPAPLDSVAPVVPSLTARRPRAVPLPPLVRVWPAAASATAPEAPAKRLPGGILDQDKAPF